MALDPRTNFTVRSACPRSETAKQTDAAEKKSFFEEVGQGAVALAGVEAFQGPVADGLRSLVGVSDAIRSGDVSSAIITNGLDPTTQGGEDGANVVLTAVGIEPNVAVSASAFNPGVVNRGTAEAQSVYDRVKQGNFKLDDIPGSFQSLQNLSTLAGGIFTPAEDAAARIELCGAVPYARALIKYAPKYKFLFIVQFTFKPEYTTLDDDHRASKMAFVVKNGGRPNVNFEHEEVNMYNFHTRVAKRTVYEPITMRFIDDQQGNSHYFMNHYIRAISPISRLPSSVDGSTSITNHQYFEERGLSKSLQSSASLTKLKGNVTSIFDEIRVFHLLDNGKQMSAYAYANPKIMSINFDDLDMSETGNGNEIEIQFAYDKLHIMDGISTNSEQQFIGEISGGALSEDELKITPVYGATDSEDSGGGADLSTPPSGDTEIPDGPEIIEEGTKVDQSLDLPEGAVTVSKIDEFGNVSSSTFIP